MKEELGGRRWRADGVGGAGRAALAVTSHYALKQALSSPIFQRQRAKANDRSRGYSSLRVHMANMIMSFADTIKVTFADGGWQRRLRSPKGHSSLFASAV